MVFELWFPTSWVASELASDGGLVELSAESILTIVACTLSLKRSLSSISFSISFSSAMANISLSKVCRMSSFSFNVIFCCCNLSVSFYLKDQSHQEYLMRHLLFF